MAEEQDRLEIQRVVNLVQGFGWNVPRQEFTDDEIVIELRKKRTVTEKTPEMGPD